MKRTLTMLRRNAQDLLNVADVDKRGKKIFQREKLHFTSSCSNMPAGNSAKDCMPIFEAETGHMSE